MLWHASLLSKTFLQSSLWTCKEKLLWQGLPNEDDFPHAFHVGNVELGVVFPIHPVLRTQFVKHVCICGFKLSSTVHMVFGNFQLDARTHMSTSTLPTPFSFYLSLQVRSAVISQQNTCRYRPHSGLCLPIRTDYHAQCHPEWILWIHDGNTLK